MYQPERPLTWMMSLSSQLSLAKVLWTILSMGAISFNPTDELFSKQTQSPNVVLICIDDLRPELACFGATYIISPNLDQLAKQGTAYSRHYVQAPTCGASRFALLTGRYGPANNDALFARAKRIQNQQTAPVSMPQWFREHGYTTVSIGKVSHHPGGRGGAEWDEDTQLEMPFAWDRAYKPAGAWQHPRGWMHGLANGEIRIDAGKMSVFQHQDVEDAAYPDGLTVPQALEELQTLAQTNKPFFLAVGLLRPHLPLGVPAADYHRYDNVAFPPITHPEKPAGKTTWHASGEFMRYQRWGKDPNSDPEFAAEVRKHYAACVTFADRQVGKLLNEINRLRLEQNTIVVVWGDHGWHLGEHAIWGKHSLFEESLRAPLIVRTPNRNHAKAKSDAKSDKETELPSELCDQVCETIDIFPTLCHLCRLPVPDSLHGKRLPEFETTTASTLSHSNIAISYFGSARSIRTERYRLTLHNSGQMELYNHNSSEKESKNLAAAEADLARQLKLQLIERWQSTHDEVPEPSDN